jgi:hypothetical protein
MPDRPSSDVPEDGRDHGPLSSGPAPSPYDAKQLKSMKGRHRFRLRYVLLVLNGLGDIDCAPPARGGRRHGDKVLAPLTFIDPARWWRINNAIPDFFAFGKGMDRCAPDCGPWR